MTRFTRTLVLAAAVFALVTVAQAQTTSPDPDPTETTSATAWGSCADGVQTRIVGGVAEVRPCGDSNADAQTPTPDPAPEARRAHPCAVVDPVRNKIVWFTRRHEVRRAWYEDAGDRIVYSRPVPRVVRQLVENGTRARLRARCS